MKIKIVLSVLLLLMFSLFVGNWIYGKILANRLDAYLQHSSNQVDVEYEKVQVNPLWSKVIFFNFSYIDPSSHLAIASEKLSVTMKYAEVLAISKSHKVDELTKLALDFESLTIREGDELILRSQDAQFDFKGDMSKDTFEKLGDKFPDDGQYVGVALRGVKFENATSKRARYTTMLAGLQYVETVSFELSFDPENRKINVESLKMETEKLKFAGKFELAYLGQGWNDFSASEIDVEYESKITDEMSWTSFDSMESFYLQSFNSELDAKLELTEDGGLVWESSEANLALTLKGMTLAYSDQRKKNIDMSLSMLGLKSEDLKVQSFSFYSSLNAGKWTIENTKLLLPMLQANLQADIQLDGNNLKNSNIEALKMRISHIDPKLNESIGNLAGNFGIKIPRDGDDIVLEVQGSIGKPRVKGIH